MTERLHIDLEVPSGTCGVCRHEPRSKALTLGGFIDDVEVEVIICRDCLAEYAPNTLCRIENEFPPLI